ncbi:MAG: lysine--tRNA ligase [Parcubacteria group bacterium]|nr:lysine--tRNA ligase [Parcubacteria group bacterium]
MALEEIRKARLKKLENIKKAGIDPYPAESFRSHKISEALENFDKLSGSGEKVILAGRLMSWREHGGSVFGDLKDESGSIQIFLKKDALGEKDFNFFLENFDIGDFIEAGGVLMKTKAGEPTLEVQSFRMLAKTISPLPEKWHGLQDIEERFRKRYLDLIFNKEVKNEFYLRFKIIQKIRQYFLDRGCLEVETPILQIIPGGALAKPFKTHLNTLDLDLYLRVAPELFLKRLLIGGFESVFEIGRNFRNEGIDRDHNPEFTMLEAYFAYRDYNWLMGFTEDLFVHLNGNFKKPFKRIKFNELVEERDNADEVFKKSIRPKIIEPTFVIDHPVDLSPLAKKLGEDQHHVARFQLIAGGFELCNAFSELNDPLDQKERFDQQKKLKGDEVHPYDREFLEALEYGMPPAAGIGIGIDRLVMLLADSKNLREIILFPTMKPRD